MTAFTQVALNTFNNFKTYLNSWLKIEKGISKFIIMLLVPNQYFLQVDIRHHIF